MSKNLQKILRSLDADRLTDGPRELWVGQARERLLSEIRATLPEAQKGFLGRMAEAVSIFFPARQAAFAVRTMGVAAFSFLFVIGGGAASAQVFHDALPGTALYSAKRLVERAQVLLSPNEAYRLRLNSDLADRRIDEIARLAESSDPSQQRQIPLALAGFRSSLEALGAGLSATHSARPETVADTAKMLERKTLAYQHALSKAGSLVADAGLRSQLRQAVALNDGVTLRAMSLLVEQHLAGDTQAPRTVVVTNFEEHIKQAEVQLDNAILAGAESQPAEPVTNRQPTKGKVLRARTAIEEARVLVKQESFQAALTKIVEASELAKEVAEDAAPVEEQPAPAEQPAAEPAAEDEQQAEPAPAEPQPEPAEGVSEPVAEEGEAETAPAEETPDTQTPAAP